ncbi:hypothetical protein HDV00_000383 [Rhizophlyctis rosea]|nr:hypothetical protein HDV00_000383 [Rhizophlyctis rosea]
MTTRPAPPPSIQTTSAPATRTAHTPSPTTPRPAYHPPPLSPSTAPSANLVPSPTEPIAPLSSPVVVTFTEADAQGASTETPSDAALGRRGGVCVTEPGSPGPVALTIDDIKSFYDSPQQ